MSDTTKGIITYMFKNCPKPDGWFGCIFRTTRGDEFKITGTTTYPIRVNDRLSCELRPNPKDPDAYIAGKIRVLNMTRRGLVRYLTSSHFPTIGEKTASKLLDIYDDTVMDVIRENPEDLKRHGFSDTTINILLAGALSDDGETLIATLIPELPPRYQKTMTRHYVDDFAELPDDVQSEIRKSSLAEYLTKHPYQPLLDIPSMTGSAEAFKALDVFASKNGLASLDKTRVNCVVSLILRRMTNDSKGCFIDLGDAETANGFLRDLYDMLRITLPQPDYDVNTPDELQMYLLGVINPRITRFSGRIVLYDNDLEKAEKTCAAGIRALQGTESRFCPLSKVPNLAINEYIADYETLTGTVLNNDQKNAVHMALRNNISVITGGPGRGKTTILACIIYVLGCIRADTPRTRLSGYAMLAPTGRAAKRMQESVVPKMDEIRQATQSAHGNLSTVPSEMFLQTRYINTVDMAYCTDSDMSDRFVIIDEASMMDIRKAAMLFDLIDGKDIQLVVVGDTDQLPAVANGQFLYDITHCPGIPVTTLYTCYRMGTDAGIILENAERVNVGDKALTADTDEQSGHYLRYDTESDRFETAMRLFRDHYVQGGTDTCLLSPLRKDVAELNIALQKTCNPAVQTPKKKNGLLNVSKINGVPVPNTSYGTENNKTQLRTGDRVILTKNKMKTLRVANGDVGVILGFYHQDEYGYETRDYRMSVRLDNGRIVELPENYYQNVELAYAITVHKSQGGEYKNVILSMPQTMLYTNAHFASRNLLYTAITRAADKCMVIGPKEVLDTCIENKLPLRDSMLADRILYDI